MTTFQESSGKKSSLLVVVPFYVPGFRGGGPIRSIANLTDRLGNDFDFNIVTSDRDLNDTRPYDTVPINTWTKVGQASVLYCGPDQFNARQLVHLIKSSKTDALYLNTFFSFKFGILPLVISIFSSGMNILVAPRGEFSPGALKQKLWKKRLYLSIAKLSGIYNRVLWQASTEVESEDIQRAISVSPKNIRIARNLTKAALPRNIERGLGRDDAVLRICFLSRITEKKNLAFALKVLLQVESTVEFGIYGPVESPDYWKECLALIEAAPSNVSVQYHGSVENSNVEAVLSSYDLFFLPTLGENFGHVFVESFAAGVPVLVSDKTPWRNLESHGIGWDLSLTQPSAFVAAIDGYAKTDGVERSEKGRRCIEFARKEMNGDESTEENRRLFLEACQPK